MQCPNCGAELPEGCLICEKCGEEIQIVPEYDPTLEALIGVEKEDQADDEAEEEQAEEKPVKRHKQYAMRALIAVLSIAVIVLIVLTRMNVAHSQSAEFQIAQAEKSKNTGDYTKALEYYNRAIELDGENVDLLVEAAKIYFFQNNQVWYEAMLKRIMTHSNATEGHIAWARERLIPVMVKKGDFEGICKMVNASGDEGLMTQYAEYLAPTPELSMEGGEYEDIQSLTISSEAEGNIYYTTDGSVPGDNSIPYTMPIVLDEGTTTVKACLINAYGVKSAIAEGTYVIKNTISQ